MTLIADELTVESVRAATAAEWAARSPSSPDEILAFYRESTALADDLEMFHRDPERQRWTECLVHVVSGLRPFPLVVDVGSGAGHDLRALRAVQAQVYGVEPNRRLANACRTDGFTVLETVEDAPIEQADLIQCIDVLEHVPNPEAFLRGIALRGKVGALILETTATFDLDTPLHLRENAGWHPGRALRRHGWECIDQQGRLRVWKRLQEERIVTTHVMVCSDRNVSGETFDSILRLVMSNTPEFGWLPGRAHESGLLRARNIWLSNWYRTTADDVCLMFDSDVQFEPEVAEKLVRLAREKHGIAVAPYVTRDGANVALRSYEGTHDFGPGCAPVPIRWGSTGAMAIHRDVVDAMVPTLPLVHANSEHCYWPMFAFHLVEDDVAGGVNELSEDWEFCRRASELGFEVWLDPSLKIVHWGMTPLTISNMDDIQRARLKAAQGSI